ncbi:MAG: glutamate formimidoyltransferase [Bryobacteraceae bacterium]|nr:glutamate formimidoyltransferase [Bryobacteraceae bacterium]
MRKLVECVPNFSEGRDRAKVAAITAAIASAPGAVVLDIEMDADHNRSVITFAAPPETVIEAALNGIGKAVELIDLTCHTGVHPRIGAADVVPFVPLAGVTLDQCVKLAEKAATEMWKRFGVPAYLYEAAARREDRRGLENIRRGQFEGLREAVKTDPDRAPDVGGPELHPTAGATVTGARKFLIAYNINLQSDDLALAKEIARTVRTSSGGMPCVKGMGVMLESRNLAQVSMNLTDFETTPVHVVYERVKQLAAARGVEIEGSEIIGLIPKRAIEMAAEHFLKVEEFRPPMVLENRVEQALEGRTGLNEFLESLAAPTPTPGGGSAAAAAAAMAAALGEMVARLSKLPAGEFEADRRWFSQAVERDAESYDAVVAAYRIPKGTDGRAEAIGAAMKGATLVPLETAERVHQLSARLATLAEACPSKVASDVVTARALSDAARSGALANVEINLGGLNDEVFKGEVEARLAAIS